jgi:hypothetical protein
MDMDNKKPPPGATLLNRLREKRLQREKELAEKEKKGSSAAESKPAGSKASKAVSKPKLPAVNKTTPVAAETFVSRHISIDDLRPSTYEYGQLTQEIRSAGRFAAAGLIAQGFRLHRLQAEDIYKDHQLTFEDYCRNEHNMSATYAYRLIRMSEMAEQLAKEGGKPVSSRGTDSMPDPFEVLLGLGHRHLLAMLPLETSTVSDLLLKGLPTQTEAGNRGKRIPISAATEQQIREAIKLLLPQTATARKKTGSTPALRAVHTLEDLVDVLQDWQNWLQSEPDEKLINTKLGDRTQINKLTRRFQTISEKFVESLHVLNKH